MRTKQRLRELERKMDTIKSENKIFYKSSDYYHSVTLRELMIMFIEYFELKIQKGGTKFIKMDRKNKEE